MVNGEPEVREGLPLRGREREDGYLNNSRRRKKKGAGGPARGVEPQASSASCEKGKTVGALFTSTKKKKDYRADFSLG